MRVRVRVWVTSSDDEHPPVLVQVVRVGVRVRVGLRLGLG